MVTVLSFELFCPALLGNLIQTRSEDLQFRLYSANWEEIKGTESMKVFLIFNEALKSPLSIRFGKIYVVNLDAFKTVSLV